MRHVFGPVPSRRLGRSLGIDPVPLKTCNWNCVYCQLGRTRPVVNDRREWVPAGEVVEEVGEALRRRRGEGIDWITFVGSGEPTLHIRLGWMIRRVKELGGPPVAVITNGALLHRPEVREELLAADAVMPTLDAGNADLYRRLNRPHPGVPFDAMVEGLVAFGSEYEGFLWPEVMLVRGANDDEESLREVGAILARVGPDRVHLNVPSRSPAEPWVEPADPEGVARAGRILGGVAEPVPPGAPAVGGPSGGDLAEAIVGIVSRHPMTEAGLAGALGGERDAAEVGEALARLREEGRIRPVVRHGALYWAGAGSFYPDEGEGAPRV